jgi:RNA polymerase sigma factor (sigma-70 family)
LAKPGNIAAQPLPTPATSEDKDLFLLIRDCIANNRNAQKALYDKFAPVLYGIIRRYVYNNNIAQEILNDVFYRVFTRLPQYSFEGAFEGWMRRIAINIISDHFRRNAKHSVVTDKDIDTIDTNIDNDTIGRINYKALLELIHELPDTQRAVFNLHVFEDYPHKEIAQLLEITENNSRWHLNDARRRLKEKINNLI